MGVTPPLAAGAAAAATASATVAVPLAEKLLARGDGAVTAAIPMAYAVPSGRSGVGGVGAEEEVDEAGGGIAGFEPAFVEWAGGTTVADDKGGERCWLTPTLALGPVDRDRCVRYWVGGESGEW